MSEIRPHAFAADIVPGQTQVQVYGHTYTRADVYETQAKATISADGKTVIWVSGWMNGGRNVYTFLARIKP